MPSNLSKAATEISNLIGSQYVITDEEKRKYFSEDLSTETLETAAMVVQPGTADEVAGIVRIAVAHGIPIVPRGGGMSYTRGYMPAKPGSIIVDTRRLNRIVEINTEDMYVTVEAGCTWEQLNSELQPLGVRTPFWGTLSGYFSTIGGGLGQNSTFLGAARYGTMADSVLSVEVVLGTGQLIRTGSAGRRSGVPYFRYFGPDLTGLFIGDAGALGIKTKVTMQLMKAPTVLVAASYGFKTLEDMLKAQGEMAQLKVASETYSMDAYYHESFGKMGFTYLADHNWTLHFTVDEVDEQAAELALSRLKEVASRYGEELEEDILPLASRAVPFARLRSNEGRLTLPVHTLVPYSRALATVCATIEFFEKHAERLAAHGIRYSIRTSSGMQALLVEPAFYWRDQFSPLRLESLDPDEAETHEPGPSNLEARRVAIEVRDELRDLYMEMGGASMQLGKYYNWAGYLEEANVEVFKQLKAVFDPNGLLNPGALGFK